MNRQEECLTPEGEEGEMAELKGPQQRETQGRLQRHSRLARLGRTRAPLKAHSSEVWVSGLTVESH